jgi:hypothetical protein
MKKELWAKLVIYKVENSLRALSTYLFKEYVDSNVEINWRK